MRAVDLNADLAEGDVFSSRDIEILDTVTSASLACGFHAGNRGVMRAAATASVRRGVVIGAHVSFRDRAGFGRRAVDVSPTQLVDDIVEQCDVLAQEEASAGGAVEYVKPHGALYNQMGTDPTTAAAVIEAVAHQHHRVLVGQSGTVVVDLARRAGVRVVPEGFPDRGYVAGGHLVARHDDGALVDDPDITAERAVSMVRRGGLLSVEGTWVPMAVETLCIHGDAAGAVASARRVRAALESEGIALRSFARTRPGDLPGDRAT
jgi:UPF0271 protein